MIRFDHEFYSMFFVYAMFPFSCWGKLVACIFRKMIQSEFSNVLAKFITGFLITLKHSCCIKGFFFKLNIILYAHLFDFHQSHYVPILWLSINHLRAELILSYFLFLELNKFLLTYLYWVPLFYSDLLSLILGSFIFNLSSFSTKCIQGYTFPFRILLVTFHRFSGVALLYQATLNEFSIYIIIFFLTQKRLFEFPPKIKKKLILA